MKNILAIDYGTKRIGLAYSVDGIISTLPSIKNDPKVCAKISQICHLYQIEKIYIGLSQCQIAHKINSFFQELNSTIGLPLETVDETFSTIEADQIYLANKHQRKSYQCHIDSIAAAVILSRVTS